MSSSPYADLSRPPLREAGLRRALLADGGLWTELRVVAETGSTNADVADAARAGADEGLVLIAETQHAGRGRLDRRWEAPAQSSITLSVLVRPVVPPVRLGWLPLLAGVALAESVGRIAVVDAGLKWPNDLLVRSMAGRDGYGKCAGVLAEAVGDAGGARHRAQRHPAGRRTAAAGRRWPSGHVAGAGRRRCAPTGTRCCGRFLRTLADWYGRWRSRGRRPGALAGCARRTGQHCLTLGERVTVALPGGDAVVGTASDVDADGRLVVATADGPRTLAAGDVKHVR